MWAQGLTIGVLMVAGALTHKNRQDAAASNMRRVSVMCDVFTHSNDMHPVYRRSLMADFCV